MKILQISQSLGPGGAERLIVELCNRLTIDYNDEVLLLTIRDENIPKNIYYLNDLSPKVRIKNLHCISGLQLKAFWGIFQTIKDEKPDIIHSHFFPILLFLPAIILCKHVYIFTIHTLADKQMAGFGLLKRIIAKYLYKTNKVKPVTISDTCHLSYVMTYKMNNDTCITNGREPMHTTEKKYSVKEEIEKLKHNEKTNVFIHVARHHPVKNHERLFNVFKQLEEDDFNFILIVLGDNYNAWIDNLKDNQHIFLMGAKDNVGDYMSQADFFVLSSDWEGLPISLLEAMSMGIIPISTPAGGVIDVIKDGTNGYLAEDFSDELFLQKIKQAINEKGKISPTTVKDYYEKNFSMEICANNYHELYQDALKKHHYTNNL